MIKPRPVKPTLARYGAAAVLLALFGSLPNACTFHPDDRCGKHQLVYGDNELCVCDTTSVWTASGCVPCAAHEVPGVTGCVCEAGYSRPAPGAACDVAPPTPMGLGIACSDSEPCMDPLYNHCQKTSVGTAYCTNTGCATQFDCGDGYGCDTTVSPSVCKQPPVGQSKSCTSPADCAGTEATYCDTFVSHSCLVQGCRLAPDNCFSGWDCCDLTQYGVPLPICVPQGGCPT